MMRLSIASFTVAAGVWAGIPAHGGSLTPDEASEATPALETWSAAQGKGPSPDLAPGLSLSAPETEGVNGDFGGAGTDPSGVAADALVYKALQEKESFRQYWVARFTAFLKSGGEDQGGAKAAGGQPGSASDASNIDEHQLFAYTRRKIEEKFQEDNAEAKKGESAWTGGSFMDYVNWATTALQPDSSSSQQYNSGYINSAPAGDVTSPDLLKH